MKTLKIFILTLFVATALFSCKKDYVIGGETFNAKVNMTTYDYLKTNHAFDTLVLMINKMQLKDEVNTSGTFFAVTNYSIHNYVKAKEARLRVTQNDENLVYTFDDIDFVALKDSLKSYMFKDKFSRDNLTEKGLYVQSKDGERRLLQLLPSTDYTNGIFTTKPQYIYFTKVVPLVPGGTLPTTIDGIVLLDARQFLYTLCQTTGIITTTGVLHVLSNDHTFAFFGSINN
jgi:uncharacterized protein YkuJ